MNLANSGSLNDVPERPLPAQVLTSMDLEGVAARIRLGEAKNILVMCGAGISVSAGIPDFRWVLPPTTQFLTTPLSHVLPHASNTKHRQ